MQARREEEEARRKQEEIERKRVKEDQERERKANFVIIKKSNELVGGAGDEEKEEGEGNKMSKEQMEQERKAILTQRIQPLEIDDFDEAKLKSKAENRHRDILRLEG